MLNWHIPACLDTHSHVARAYVKHGKYLPKCRRNLLRSYGKYFFMSASPQLLEKELNPA
jgi:hypothetical protein